MTKTVRITMWTGGLLAALLVVGVVIFAATFDLNDYRDRIVRLVRDATGRTLTLSGDLKLMFFPRLGVSTGGATLSNAEGFGDGPMAAVRRAEISFRLWPLLSGKVQVGHVYLDGLEVHLARDAEGRTNWEDLTRRTGAAPAAKTSGGAVVPEVDGVVMENAGLTWDDRESGVFLKLDDLVVVLRKVRPGLPVPVLASFSFESGRPEARGDVTAACTATLEKDGNLRLADAKVTVKAEGAAVPGGKGTAEATAGTMELAGGRLRIKGLALAALGVKAHFDGGVEWPAEGGERVVGSVAVEPFDGRALWTALTGREPDTADPKALGRVEGAGVVAYTSRSLALKGLDLKVDGDGLRGDARVSGGDDGVSCYARLDADAVDLDRYLPPRTEVGTADGAVAGKRGSADARILRAERLRRLTVDAEMKAARLHVRGLWLDKVEVGLKGRNGLIRLSPADAELYGGKASLAATVNALTDRPKSEFLVALDKVDIGPLSRDVLGDASYAGKLDLKGTFACEGERRSAMLASLNGKFRLQLADGVFPGVDLSDMARTTQQSKRKEGTVEASAGDSTRFGSIEGSGVIRNGVLENRDLEVKAPGLRAAGEGAVSLPTGRIDYLLKVKLVPTSVGQGGRTGDEMFGIMVPVRVTGTVENPHYGVSLTEYVKALGGAVIGVAGSVYKGVTGVLSTVGEAVVGSNGGEAGEAKEKKNLFNLFGLF